MAPMTVRGGNASPTDNADRAWTAPHGRGQLAIFCAVAAWLLATVPDAAEPHRTPVVRAQVPVVSAQTAKMAQAPQSAPPPGGDRPQQPQPPSQPGSELPPPRTLEGFGPGQSRLERMGVPRPFGSTPAPTEKDLALQRQLVEEIIDPHNVLDLVINRARVLVTKEPPFRVQIGDEHVA